MTGEVSMTIVDTYVSAFEKIAARYGEQSGSAHIGADDGLQEAIGYTRQYVVEHTTPHFRYKYYKSALARSFRELRYDPTGRHIVHLDLGCGPGVFSWVLHDFMESRQRSRPHRVEYCGYDHCAAMIRLAQLFAENFPEHYEFRGYSNRSKMELALTEPSFAQCDVLVTFGYALVQVRDDPTALTDFAALVGHLFPARHAIVVAADAYYDWQTRDAFREQCTAWKAALKEVGIGLTLRRTPTRSIMYGQLRRE